MTNYLSTMGKISVNATLLKDIKVKQYKHMGKIDFPIAQ